MYLKMNYFEEDEQSMRYTRVEEIRKLEILRDIHKMGIIGCSKRIEKYYMDFPEDIEFLLMVCNLNNNFVTYFDNPNVFTKKFRDDIKNNKKFFIELIKIYPPFIRYASKELLIDKEINDIIDSISNKKGMRKR